MKPVGIERDERTVSVENASYRLGFNILAYGTLVLIVLHAILWQQSGWDFMALVIVASFVSTIYQARQKIFTRRMLLGMLLAGILSALLAPIVVLILHATVMR